MDSKVISINSLLTKLNFTKLSLNNIIIYRLTERFDLTFAVSNQNLNLVPCLMSDVQPQLEEWTEEDSSINFNMTITSYNPMSIQQNNFLFGSSRLTSTNMSSQNQNTLNSTQLLKKKETKIVYEFEYLPAGLFNRAQVRLFQITDNKAIWKSGSLLKKNNHLALIIKNNNKIEIKVRGPQPENIVFLIHEVFEVLIAESFNGVNYDYSFPCPDCFEHNSIDSERSMFSASMIRRAIQKRAVFLQCRNK